jgi:hypothetical protein
MDEIFDDLWNKCNDDNDDSVKEAPEEEESRGDEAERQHANFFLNLQVSTSQVKVKIP